MENVDMVLFSRMVCFQALCVLEKDLRRTKESSLNEYSQEGSRRTKESSLYEYSQEGSIRKKESSLNEYSQEGS